MQFTEEQVLNALRTVDDPDLKKDLVSLGMIRDIKINGTEIRFSVVLTTPACPLKEKIKMDCVRAIHSRVSKYAEVVVDMTSDVTSRAESNELKQVKNVIAVVSGKGGVGKSTIATNLAIGLAKSGASVALVDADIYGPSIPIMFGMDQVRPKVRTVEGRDLIVPEKKYGIQLNSIGFLVPPEQAIVWRGPMASKAMQQLIFDTDWEPVDYMVIDMPPGTGDLHLTLVQRLAVAGVVVVTTPQSVALADARKGAEMFRTDQVKVPILGIVENMAYFTPEELPEKQYFLFGKDGGKKLAEELEVPLLGQIPIVEKVREASDTGAPVALDETSVSGQAFVDLAAETARQVAIRNASLPPTEQVKIQYT